MKLLGTNVNSVTEKKCSLLWVLSSLCTHGNVENEQQLVVVVVDVQYALVGIPSFLLSLAH